MESSTYALQNINAKIAHEVVPSSPKMEELDLRQFLRSKLKSMPHTFLKRITLLKTLQMVFNRMRIDYYRAVFDLERKYHEIHKDIYEAREDIVSGTVEPPAERPIWNSDGCSDSEIDTPEKLDFAASLRDLKAIPKNAKGVPDFWVTIFKNYEPISRIVYDYDIPALSALRDVRIHYENEISFTLEFHFNPNPYFYNEVLSKKYLLKNSVSISDPLVCEGLEIFKCTGTKIFWKEGMNLCVNTVRSREKYNGTGAIQMIVKQTSRKSFFRFFSRPYTDGGNSWKLIDDDVHEPMRTDFVIGRFLREKVIPRAVLYYTGDVMEEDVDEWDGSFESDD